MSILQKILQDMYVEPELLAELDDEQKQILFCKMREEQVRRWTAKEKEWEEEKERRQNSSTAESGSSSSSETRKVRWLTGGDGNPWVWVMGEHSDDKTIDEILEQETQDKARRLAEQEAEELRSLREEELKEKLRQEQMEAEEERMKMERQRQLAAAQQAQEDEAVRRRVELAKAKKLIESEQNEEAAVRSRQAEEAFLKRELRDQQHDQFGPWQDNGETTVVERRPRIDANDEELVERRRSEIYQTLTEARERANREAEKEAEDERRYWEEQERKAREAEELIRTIARRAREQHKQHSLRTSTSLLSLLKLECQTNRKQTQLKSVQAIDSVDGVVSIGSRGSSSGSSTASPQLPANNAMKLPRPPKPHSKEAIIEWYLKEELTSGSGLESGSSRFAPWFHGIISREDAEQLLRAPRPAGSFLVRVSARIWGYAISYKVDSVSSRVKHFLIEKVTENGTGGYQLYGTNQLVHASLWDLVEYHQTVPITQNGGELLKEAVGQASFPPDYQELLGLSGNSSSSPAGGVNGPQVGKQRP